MLSLISTFRSVLEGDTLNFQFSSDAEITGLVIRWEIIPKGALPVVIGSGGDFSAAEGSKTFTDAASAFDLDIATLENTRGGPDRDFTIRFYHVDASDPTGGSDTLIAEHDFQVIEDDVIPERLFNRNGDDNINIITQGDLLTSTTNGFDGDDYYIITPYQYGPLVINDAFGSNVIRFDGGVKIISVVEDVVDFRDDFVDVFAPGRPTAQLLVDNGIIASVDEVVTYNQVIYTLSTGATITIDTPESTSYSYQVGSGAAMDYVAFRSIIGSPTADSPYEVTTFGTLPDQSGNSDTDRSLNVNGSDVDDIMTLGGEVEQTANGFDGNDYLIVSRYLTSNLVLNDAFGTNVIRFDGGVQIASVVEDVVDFRDDFVDVFAPGRPTAQLLVDNGIIASVDEVITYNQVIYTLSTGATITIDTPESTSYSYQIGNGTVMDYVSFRELIKVSGADPTPSSLYVIPFPDGSLPVAPTNTAPTVDTPLAVNFGTDENAVFTAADFGFSDNDGGLNGRFATLKITALPTANGVLEYDDSGTWKTIILTGTAGAGEFLLTDGEIAVADLAKLRLNPADSYMGDVTFTYRVIDGGGEASATDTTATVTFSTPAAVTSGDTGTALPENTEVATDTAVYTATSEGFSGAVSWSLSGADADLFDIDASTGVVTFKTATTPDYETKSSYSFTVTATLGAVTAEQAVTIAVTDVNEDDSLPVVEAGYYAYDSTANEFRKYDADGNVETGVAFERVNLNTTNNTIRLDSNLPAGDAERVSLLGGDDIYEIYGDLVRDITISETEGTDNLVRFMDGVRIISVETESPPGGGAEKLVIKLGTATPSATETATIELLGGVGRYNFQFGNGQVIDLVDELADLPVGVQLDIP